MLTSRVYRDRTGFALLVSRPGGGPPVAAAHQAAQRLRGGNDAPVDGGVTRALDRAAMVAIATHGRGPAP